MCYGLSSYFVCISPQQPSLVCAFEEKRDAPHKPSNVLPEIWHTSTFRNHCDLISSHNVARVRRMHLGNVKVGVHGWFVDILWETPHVRTNIFETGSTYRVKISRCWSNVVAAQDRCNLHRMQKRRRSQSARQATIYIRDSLVLSGQLEGKLYREIYGRRPTKPRLQAPLDDQLALEVTWWPAQM